MFELLGRFLGRRSDIPSKNIAKERLRMVLVQDRAGVPPQIFEKLKVDLIRAASKYMDVDEGRTQVHLDNDRGETMALVANIPVLRLKSENGSARRSSGKTKTSAGSERRH